MAVKSPGGGHFRPRAQELETRQAARSERAVRVEHPVLVEPERMALPRILEHLVAVVGAVGVDPHVHAVAEPLHAVGRRR